MKLLFSLLVLFGFSSPVLAAKKVKTVKFENNKIAAQVISLNRTKGKILVKSKQFSKIKAGDILTYGKYCTLEVSKKTTSRAILLTDLCRRKDLPKVGAKVSLRHQAAEKFSAKRTKVKVINNNKIVTRYKKRKVPKTKAATGFRIEVSKPTLEQAIKTTDLEAKDLSRSSTFETEGNTSAVSASMGYTRVNIKDLGLSTKVMFTHYDADNQGIRASLSATYGFNEHIYVFAGGNGHKFTRGLTELAIGAGYQAGVGVQLNDYFGLEVSKIQINNEGVVDNEYTQVYQADGVELSLHLTF